ncbi:class I SAM-dependent methyltransferase [Chitinophagaceae bacterium LB-8]|jgi:ubiquinone/menaquinone biosynthesis C-methylase UbiE|uniref:Class I SAM-dependent methyltransferase n=1 Tax=Paraflavisolibacter caeni TaxID=2982496 RepID=A0A9X3B7L4_9BACT|nr:methyltransferase domain-containing protein [Paraflavisolibacter caeni]MCU7548601.1 class I SAM-dependent methyltransferase [Paraflavisolibacter caeni]
MDSVRKPFQGVWNIIRFNWHYYILSIFLVLFILLLQKSFNQSFKVAANILALLIISSTLITLIVSLYIYDFSKLYTLTWLSNLKQGGKETIININAGFDETSSLLKRKFENSELLVADFYDPEKHTELSIKRARKAYPPFPNTFRISTKHLPIEDSSADKIFAILSAHEIRNEKERIAFFNELQRVLKASGQIIVTEHLRDTANFLAYNIGFFHFHSKATWHKTFHSSRLQVAKEIKITPFISTFILEKNGSAS